MEEDKVVRLTESVDFYESEYMFLGPLRDTYRALDRQFMTEKQFCLQLDKIYWADRWSWWKRVKFEIGWLWNKTSQWWSQRFRK
jgi:hypothetical protein